MSGAADSLYSQDDLFFTVQADVAGAGRGCSCAQLLCPLQRLLGGAQCSYNEYGRSIHWLCNRVRLSVCPSVLLSVCPSVRLFCFFRF